MCEKRIVLFAQGLTNRAGIERMTVALANLLADTYKVSIVLIEPFSYANLPYELKSSVYVESLNSSFGGLNLKNIRNLRRVVKRLGADVMITVATPLVRISAPALMGLGVRNIAWEHFNLYAGSRIGSVWKWVSTFLVEKTVVLCDHDAGNFRKNRARNVTAIYNFSSIGEENEPSECREKVILAVGRHAHQKGFDMLLKAWAKVDAGDWKLRIVGDGALYEENVSLAEELGISEKVIFAGSTSDIVEEYRKASCFVLSSRYEGLVMVLIEARMMGLTCVSFDCPTGPREIIRDGVDGFLVEPEDIEGLAKQMSEVIRMGNLKEMGQLARTDAIHRYGTQKATSEWMTLIESRKRSDTSLK